MKKKGGAACAVGVVGVMMVTACSIFTDLDGYAGGGDAADAATKSPSSETVPGSDAQARCGLGDPIYHVRAPTSNDQFYTASSTEARQAATNAGYTDDRGIAFYASATPDGGLVPAYRLNKPALFTATHLWTSDEAEKQRAIQSGGFQDEGIGFYVAPSVDAGVCLVPVTRFRDPSTGNYTFAIRDEDRSAYLTSGWIDEGTAFYASP